MAGQFVIDHTFSIRGRGPVVCGKIVSGTIEKGMTFTIPTIDEPIVVQSVDIIRSVQPSRRETGLLCAQLSEANQAAWRELDVGGLEITVA
ncbi:MAG: hypothetical protein R3E58_16795 [Phycisphaerae bacterium]|nr:hypothetical protein [Phycisphaerales bacterium]